MSMKIKKKRRYGDYVCRMDGKDYAVVRLPNGGGTYKKKVKLLSRIGGTKAAAAKWVMTELAEHRAAQTDEILFEIYRDAKGDGIDFSEFKERIENYAEIQKR